MTEKLNKITYLSEEQYNELKEKGKLNESQLYFTPEEIESSDLSGYVTKEYIDSILGDINSILATLTEVE